MVDKFMCSRSVYYGAVTSTIVVHSASVRSFQRSKIDDLFNDPERCFITLNFILSNHSILKACFFPSETGGLFSLISLYFCYKKLRRRIKPFFCRVLPFSYR